MKQKILEGANNNRYLLREDGMVISLGRIGARGHIIKNRVLTPRLNNKGYYRVTLNLNGKSKAYYLHRLLAESFIPNPFQFNIVDHIDGNKTNNALDNLEWVTSGENNKRAFKLGLKQPTVFYGEEHWGNVLTWEDVKFIRSHYIPRDNNFGQCALARKFNTSQSNIYDIINYNTWKEENNNAN